MSFSKKVFLAIFSLFFVTSCVETVVVGSVATGVVVIRDKSVTNTRKDIVISTEVASKFLVNGLKNYGDSVDVTVNEGRVLLTGIVRDSSKAKAASELTWKVKGVKEVIDEIQVRDDEKVHLKDYAIAFGDYVITNQIEAKMLFDSKVPTLNYQTTTVDGIVYFLGVASDEVEKNRLLAMAAKVRGVRRVVDHIILSDDSRRR
ncbi:MAG: BON domain-containing protein [Rickettsiales bacterium]|nr:BON domain-containing protein [Rickettsiales bacterium]